MDGSGVGPSWAGLFGSQVTLESGQTVTADEAYIKQSIRDPMSQIVAGYQPVMPDFDGQINDTQLTDLIDYIKSLAQSQ
jgi:cytochrome c oxidase subunit 2